MQCPAVLVPGGSPGMSGCGIFGGYTDGRGQVRDDFGEAGVHDLQVDEAVARRVDGKAQRGGGQEPFPAGSGIHPARPGATGQCAQLRRERTRTACRAPRSHQPTARRHGPRAASSPCRFDLLPPCTPATARHRTPRSDWASRAARIGSLSGDPG
jgi:hypothetical protein